ncbi:MAG: UDP-N-acetylmuramoyl-L-alanyl-D-glutamate--2,6-diaminopimelate ligase [Bacteroidales bacterium]|nr:UDP-N-acetylmuramoyl-L-alanyl-D-glutamate--2,6-diaminopimelate ligase [Bacteroidales bacterium]
MAKKLNHILKGINCRIIGKNDLEINRLVFDSRKAAKDDLFVAVKGTHVDGHTFLSDVVEKGVAAIICEDYPDQLAEQATFIVVEDSAEALGLAAANYYDEPSKSLHLVGVTGTNGKTSIVTLLYKLFNKMDQKSGLLSTIRNMVGEETVQATHTTPDAITIQSLLRKMVDSGCSHAFMEVSSHAIDQKRIKGLDFNVVVFTNITHDHLDYHQTFDAYLKAKKQLFDDLSSDATALVNADDKHSKVIVQNTSATIKSYGLRSIADYKAKIIESHFDGMLVNIENTELWTQVIGEFNASNLLAVYAVTNLLGYPKEEILRVLSTLGTVEGRFEYLRSENNITAIIDYAHTPDALQNVLITINQIMNTGCQLITVVGAGGDRDKMKRPVMGKIAAELSSRVIFTSDNPRSEEPQQIIDEMIAGVDADNLKSTIAIVDRREAIRTACMMAHEGDVILIAGKGHETYQEIKGERNFFNDKQIVKELFMINNINPQ